MKRALRVIVPLLLILAVLASTVWYFMIYDRDLTKEMILRTARTLEAGGKHEAAAWMYDLAYSQSSQEDAVAIELSNQYRDSGNYTKAEYSLTEAISKNPTAELYIALSKLYVEQDKLLDAVKLMDTVLNEDIKAQLEAQRPQAPTVSYEPAFYNQYISVAVEAPSGTLYVSADGDYPSTAKDLYSEPIALGIGETVLYCLTVGENGLVSPLGLFGYTVGGVVEEVTFTDAAIEAALRQQLNAGSNSAVYTNDLWNITEFVLPAEAERFEDLALLTRLRSLTVTDAPAGVLAALGKAEYMESLTMIGCALSDEDLTALGSLTTLKELTLSDCGLSSVSALQSLTGLTYLDLSSNTLRNLTPLSGMYSLRELYLGSNAVTDLSALSGLSALTVLDVSYNSLTSLDSVCNIAGLSALNAAQNQITDITRVGQLAALTELDVSFNKISDVSALAACTALESLSISNNTIVDVTALKTLNSLQRFYLANNQVTALPAFSADCALVTIDASYNLLLTIEELTALPQLNSVNVDYNEGIESLEPLEECPVLIQVNAYGTQVTEVGFLTEQSIVVNFDPTL